MSGPRLRGLIRSLPPPVGPWLVRRARAFRVRPPVGLVRFGSLRRLEPISRGFGYDRGTPVDRYYVEAFLRDNAHDIRGAVLEIGDNWYSTDFGDDRVTTSEVLHAVEGNPMATIVGDLADPAALPEEAYDCIILTQTLLVIWDVRAAIRNVHRALRPGGVVLATFPGVSHRVITEDLHLWGDYWRFTSISARRLFAEAFGDEGVSVRARGNVLTAIAFLHGLAAEDLRRHELEHDDRPFEVSIGVRAVKAARP